MEAGRNRRSAAAQTVAAMLSRLALVLVVIAAAAAPAASPEDRAAEANAEALARVRRGDLVGAFGLFRRAAALDPGSAQYHNNAGKAALRLERVEDARKHLQLAADLAPGSGLPAANLREVAALERSMRARRMGLPPGCDEQRGCIDDEPTHEDAQAVRDRRQRPGGPPPPPSKTRAPTLREIPGDHHSGRWGRRRNHSTRRLPRIHVDELYLPRNRLYRNGALPFVLVGVPSAGRGWAGVLGRARAERAAAVGGAGASASGARPADPFGPRGTAGLPLWDSPHSARGAGGPVVEALRRLSRSGSASDPVAGDTRSTWTLGAIARAFGSREAEAYPHNMERSSVQPVKVPLEEALWEVVRPSGAHRRSGLRPRSGYVQWNIDAEDWPAVASSLPGPVPPLFASDDAWLDACMGDSGSPAWGAGPPGGADAWPPARRATAPRVPGAAAREYYTASHWRMMLIGVWGAGMFGHWDVLATSSWQFQAAGAKRWHICPPAQRPLLGDAGLFDGFYPDYASSPGSGGLSCFLDVVLPGEFLYYPRNYWHQTENLATPTVSLTSTLSDAGNHRGVANELRRECSGLGRVMAPSAVLCGALDRCFEWWETAFAGRALGPGAEDVGRLALPAEVAGGERPDALVRAGPLPAAEDAGAAGSGRDGATGAELTCPRSRRAPA